MAMVAPIAMPATLRPFIAEIATMSRMVPTPSPPRRHSVRAHGAPGRPGLLRVEPGDEKTRDALLEPRPERIGAVIVVGQQREHAGQVVAARAEFDHARISFSVSIVTSRISRP